MKKDTRLSEAGAEIVGALEGFLDALQGGGEIAERFTVRTVQLDLEPRSYTSADVKETRAILGLSQALFALFLGVSVSAVRAWERGDREIPRYAARFLDEIARAPDYWKGRVRESIVDKGTGSQAKGRQPC
jgi:putative transcriptional regulator